MPDEPNRTVVYKLCSMHRRSTIEPPILERICGDCRRSIFRASMKARGITVTVPTYKGGYPHTYGSYGPSGYGGSGRKPAEFAVPLLSLFTSRKITG